MNRKRKRKSIWALLAAQCVSLTAVGCFTGTDLSQAVADDLAFTVAAATQGYLSGLFTIND